MAQQNPEPRNLEPPILLSPVESVTLLQVFIISNRVILRDQKPLHADLSPEAPKLSTPETLKP